MSTILIDDKNSSMFEFPQSQNLIQSLSVTHTRSVINVNHVDCHSKLIVYSPLKKEFNSLDKFHV